MGVVIFGRRDVGRVCRKMFDELAGRSGAGMGVPTGILNVMTLLFNKECYTFLRCFGIIYIGKALHVS